ncbi:MAG: hypothetical protein ACK5NA_11935 [Enterococcus sp.]
MDVRRAKQADTDAIQQLAQTIGVAIPTNEVTQAVTDERTIAVVASEATQICGYVQAEILPGKEQRTGKLLVHRLLAEPNNVQKVQQVCTPYLLREAKRAHLDTFLIEYE